VANSLQFKPMLDQPLKKLYKGDLCPSGGALARLGHSLARVKNFGAQHPLEAEIWYSEKVESCFVMPWLHATISSSEKLGQHLRRGNPRV